MSYNSVQNSYSSAQMSYKRRGRELRSGRQMIDDHVDGARCSNMIRH
jgi:hypothetical protein